MSKKIFTIEDELSFAYGNSYNVLLEGRPGVGKTERMKNFCIDNNINYIYLSAPTCDPWIDLVGLPWVHEDKKTNEKVLEFVRQDRLANCEVLILDEPNRAEAKTRNALLEAIQFKSINGFGFPYLKSVFAAINPIDDTELDYDVEALDPAFLDRFHIKLSMDYAPDLPYFKKKFGDLGEIACEWWSGLDMAQKLTCSPRRLDYALEMWNKRQTVVNVVPHGCRPKSLETQLDKSLNFKDKVEEMMQTHKKDFDSDKNGTFVIPELCELLSDPNTVDIIYSQCVVPLLGKRPEKDMDGFRKCARLFRHFSAEQLRNKSQTDKKFRTFQDVLVRHIADNMVSKK